MIVTAGICVIVFAVIYGSVFLWERVNAFTSFIIGHQAIAEQTIAVLLFFASVVAPFVAFTRFWRECSTTERDVAKILWHVFFVAEIILLPFFLTLPRPIIWYIPGMIIFGLLRYLIHSAEEDIRTEEERREKLGPDGRLKEDIREQMELLKKRKRID